MPVSDDLVAAKLPTALEARGVVSLAPGAAVSSDVELAACAVEVATGVVVAAAGAAAALAPGATGVAEVTAGAGAVAAAAAATAAVVEDTAPAMAWAVSEGGAEVAIASDRSSDCTDEVMTGGGASLHALARSGSAGDGAAIAVGLSSDCAHTASGSSESTTATDTVWPRNSVRSNIRAEVVDDAEANSMKAISPCKAIREMAPWKLNRSRRSSRTCDDVQPSGKATGSTQSTLVVDIDCCSSLELYRRATGTYIMVVRRDISGVF